MHRPLLKGEGIWPQLRAGPPVPPGARLPAPAGTDTSWPRSRPSEGGGPPSFCNGLGWRLGPGGGCLLLGLLGVLVAGECWGACCWGCLWPGNVRVPVAGAAGGCLWPGNVGVPAAGAACGRGMLGCWPLPAWRWALGTHCARAFPSLTVHLWGTEEVAAWLEHLSLCEYKDIFTRHDIRGSELLHLERRDLKVLPHASWASTPVLPAALGSPQDLAACQRQQSPHCSSQAAGQRCRGEGGVCDR